MSINLGFEYYLFIYFFILKFLWIMLILKFFFWLIVMFCLHALVVNTSEKMWENFKPGKILENKNKNVK